MSILERNKRILAKMELERLIKEEKHVTCSGLDSQKISLDICKYISYDLLDCKYDLSGRCHNYKNLTECITAVKYNK